MQTSCRIQMLTAATAVALCGATGVTANAAASSSGSQSREAFSHAFAQPKDIPAPDASGYQLFKNVGSNHCLSSGGQASGGTVTLYPCNGSDANQLWRLYYSSGGGGQGVDIFQNQADGLCINNRGNSYYNGNPQVMFACSTSNAGDGYVTTTSHGFLTGSGDNGYCLSSNGNNANGAPLVESACNQSANQTFSSSLFPS